MAMTDIQQKDATQQQLFRLLPSVNELLLVSVCQALQSKYTREVVLTACRAAVAVLREEVSSGIHTEASLQKCVDELPKTISDHLVLGMRYSLRPVINATGVILHTNLGRAPLSDAALRHVVEIARDYCNLEFDLDNGLRSRRDDHVEALVLRVLAEDIGGTGENIKRGVVIVNNCAAATLLALNSIAEKSEVIISRGELVEIGGGFRVPEIMEKSGAVMIEVGTTNRTRLADYERALGPNTALLLRVHQSNFSIEGFAERPLLGELITLSKRSTIPVFEDLGTGLIGSLEHVGICGEPSLRQSLASGVDLVAASGDKLLGGPQCGILVGRIDLIQRIRKNPLLRAFRVDKLTYAALEATLLAYLAEDDGSIPTQRMLSIPSEETMRRCRDVVDCTRSANLVLEVVPVASLVGGGTAPKASLPSYAISLRHASLNAAQLIDTMRKLDPPVIGRIADDLVLLDLRTVPPRFDAELASMLQTL